jgi:hypothetical protein
MIPHQNSVCNFTLPPTCHNLVPSQSPSLVSQIITKQCKFTCNCNPTVWQIPPLVMYPYITLPLVQHRYSVTMTVNCKWPFNWRCGLCTVWDW